MTWEVDVECTWFRHSRIIVNIRALTKAFIVALRLYNRGIVKEISQLYKTQLSSNLEKE